MLCATMWQLTITQHAVTMGSVSGLTNAHAPQDGVVRNVIFLSVTSSYQVMRKRVEGMEFVLHLTLANVRRDGLVHSVKRHSALDWQTVRVHAMGTEIVTSQTCVTVNMVLQETHVSMKAVSVAITMVDALGGTNVSVVEDSKATIAQVKSVVTLLAKRHVLHMVIVCAVNACAVMAGVALIVSC